ncbi:type II secretion system protein [uncultured Massilia sp.]|uniref:type II secretion system protein n=1 Tax=uncultured Massilia sp. TaxID=169973 RepID=UPI0025DF666F|nr:type II secretion system protein [uncultured Massilia sp.]
MKTNVGKQDGFTLIELIAVIVILGILAATALPKFINLTGDARHATVLGAQAALSSASNMIHAKYLIKPSEYATEITIDGKTVPMRAGYPAASLAFAEAAGISAPDYVLQFANGLLTVSARNANPDKCKVTYEGAKANASTGSVKPPKLQLTSTPADCM